MASLWSLFRKFKTGPVLEEFREILTSASRFLVKNEPLLVDANETFQYFQNHGPSAAIDFTPGHERLWLEWTEERGTREAALVSRWNLAEIMDWKNLPEKPDNARHLIEQLHFHEHQGMAVLMGCTHVFVDDMGIPSQHRHYGRENDFDGMEGHYSLAVEIVSAMNTRGTRIEPPIERSKAEIIKPNRNPHSVWRTVRLPKFQGPPLADAEVAPEILERREHWVRAHRRDYRKGAGMFGRVKALVWVPEFQRGNPELGAVKQSFAVDPQSGAK